jgi:hypothetical protein
VDSLALQLLCGADALPGAGEFDQDALRADPRFPVHANQLSRLGQAALEVKAQARIDLAGNPAGDDLEDLAAEVDQQPVHELRRAGFLVAGVVHGVKQGIVRQMFVLRLLGCLIEQRRIGRCVLRLVAGDGFEVAGVRHDGGITLEGFEQVHDCLLQFLLLLAGACISSVAS